MQKADAVDLVDSLSAPSPPPRPSVDSAPISEVSAVATAKKFLCDMSPASMVDGAINDEASTLAQSSIDLVTICTFAFDAKAALLLGLLQTNSWSIYFDGDVQVSHWVSSISARVFADPSSCVILTEPNI